MSLFSVIILSYSQSLCAFPKVLYAVRNDLFHHSTPSLSEANRFTCMKFVALGCSHFKQLRRGSSHIPSRLQYSEPFIPQTSSLVPFLLSFHQLPFLLSFHGCLFSGYLMSQTDFLFLPATTGDISRHYGNEMVLVYSFRHLCSGL
jgi:hypothetical protein